MAAARKIKRTRKSKKHKVAILPESLQAFIARRLVDAIAFAVLGTALYIAAAVLSYSGADMSANTAAGGSAGVHNLMGSQGAYIADLLMQMVGYAAVLLSVVMGFWGWRMFRRQPLRPVMMRVATCGLAVVAGAIVLSSLPFFADVHRLGGSIGSLAVEAVIQATGAGQSLLLISLFCASAVVAVLAFIHAAAVQSYEVATVWFRVKLLAYVVVGGVLSVVRGFMDWVRHYNHPEYADHAAPSPSQFNDKLSSMKAEWQAKREQKDALRIIKRKDTATKPIAKDDKPVAKPKTAPAAAANPVPDEPVHEVTSLGSIPVVKPQNADVKTMAKNNADASQQRFALSDVDGEWEFPPTSLIQDVPADALVPALNEEALRKNAELLQNVLSDFNVEGEIVSIHPGPVVTLYEFEPSPGTKSSKVISISDDIARSMSAISVRCAVVPGRNVIGIELPNKKRQTVYMKEMLQSRAFNKSSAKLPLILGKDIGGQPIMADLAKMPHLLVAGTTGSGKSVAVNTMIMSLLYRLSPEQCRFIMIDPKMLELSVYDDIPHLLSPVVTEPGKAIVALKWAVHEMENRYRAMSKLGVRNIEGYNQRIRDAIANGEEIMHKVQTGFEPDTGKPVFEDHAMSLVEFPYIVIIVDEFADLMLVAGKDVENAIQRLAQMARAAGLHLIMATQRPSVDVITGVVKANFPTRISFQVTSKIDSRTILGDGGAEQLLGMGDMLYMAPGGRIVRVHGPFASDDDVEKTTNFLRAQAKPNYITDVTSEDADLGGSDVMNAMFGGGSSDGEKVDELYDQAVAVIAKEGKVSTSFIQRHLQIGYNRAARIVEEMEKQGIISPANATGKRQILVSDFSDV